MRHEGTFFTKNFQWELADAGDFLSRALSGAGAAQSAAGLASGINEAAKAYRQWKEINVLKNLEEGGNKAVESSINPIHENTKLPRRIDLKFFGNKSDIKQIEQVAKKFDMAKNQRREFGDYIESLKRMSVMMPIFHGKNLMKLQKVL